MKRSWMRRAMLGLSMAALAAGLGAAVVDATGLNGHGHHHEHAHPQHRERRERAVPADRHGRLGGNFAVAAAYLGLTRGELRQKVLADHTAAAVAQGTPGKSPAGLEGALVNAKTARLNAATSANALSASRRQAKLAKLQERASQWATQVRPTKGRGRLAHRAARRHKGGASATHRG